MVNLDNYNENQKITCPACEDDALMYESVICGDAELLYLDTFLREVFSTTTVN